MKGRRFGLLVIPAVLVLWEAAVHLFGSANPVVPPPSEIVPTLVTRWPAFLSNLIPTGIEALGGFLIGNALAVATALLFVQWKAAEDSFYPLAVVLHSVPLVAVIPLLVIWMGPGYPARWTLTAMITFFPTLVNMVDGLRSGSKQALEIVDIVGGSHSTAFWKVRFPYSLPYLFAALKITAAISVLGAVVSEWVGASRGIGFMMLYAMFNYQPAVLWGTLGVCALLSISAIGAISLIERIAIPWHESMQSDPTGAGGEA